MSTMFVNGGGVADFAPPYVREAINRLKGQASAARAAAGATQTAPDMPSINDTTAPKPPKPPGVVSRARGALNNPISRTGRVAGFVGKRLAAPLAVAGAVGNAAADDSTARYATRFGVAEPTGDGSLGDMAKFAALRAGGFASDLGSNLTGGIAGRFFRDANMRPAAAPIAPAAAAPVTDPSRSTPVSATDPSRSSAGSAAQPPPDVVPPRAPEAPAAAPAGFVNRRVAPGIVQDGPASFTDGRSPPLPDQPISAQNQGALDALAARNTPAMMTEEQRTGLRPEVLEARRRARVIPTARGAGIVGRRLDAFLQQSEDMLGGEQRDFLAGQRAQELAKGQQALEQGAQDTALGNIELEQAGRMNEQLQRLSQLNDQTDPDGAQRAQIIESLLAMQGKEPSRDESPAQKYRREITAAALKSDFRTPEEAQQLIDQAMNSAFGQPGGGDAAPVPGAQRAPDGNWYVQQNGKWFRVDQDQ